MRAVVQVFSVPARANDWSEILNTAVKPAEPLIVLALFASLAALGCGDHANRGTAGTGGKAGAGTAGNLHNGGASGSEGGTDEAGSGGAESGAAGSGGGSTAGNRARAGAGAAAAGSGGSPAPACPANTLSPGETTKAMMYDGAARQYIVHVPPTYEGKAAVPLVIDMHGLTYSNSDQASTSGWRAKSDAEGFIVVYPNGLDKSWNGGALCCGTSQENGVDDEGFILAIIEQLSEAGCIDSKRVYATGLSNGGAMSFLLGCQDAGVFAAVAPVSMGNGTQPCEPARPISVIMYRGMKDDLVPYTGGNTYPSAISDFDQWKTLNSCTGTPRKVSGSCDQYTECKDGVEVMLCSIPNGQHLLYSGAAEAGAPVADVVWEAFKRHPLP
jgi:polyhydroxybutyrate depolymerase